MLRGAILGGLWSSSSVPSAGILTRSAPRVAEPEDVIGLVGVANTLPQNNPICACWSAVNVKAVAKSGTETGNQSALIAPRKVNVRSHFAELLELILQLSGLLEVLIMVDAERTAGSAELKK